MARIARLAAPACPPVFSGGPARPRRFSPNPSSAFGVYPPWRAVSAVKERRVPRRCFFATSYPQRRVPKSPCQKPSNSSQNRSKRRRFPSKRHQKSARFVMPILTFRGVTPSGASARAVLTCPKGKKGAFSGAPGQVPKVIHSYPQSRGSRAAVNPRRACPARVAGGGLALPGWPAAGLPCQGGRRRSPAWGDTRKRPRGNPLVTVGRVAWSRCCVTMLGAKGRNSPRRATRN